VYPLPKSFTTPKTLPPKKNFEQTSPWIFNLCASMSKIQIYRATLIWEINLEILRIERKRERKTEKQTFIQTNKQTNKQTEKKKERLMS
jgi:hypothetical protein